MYVYLTPEQYDNLRHKLATENINGITGAQESTDYSGIVETPDVTVEYNYDPQFQRAFINVVKKKSLAAKVAPDQVILAHIVEAIHTVAVTTAKEPLPDKAAEESEQAALNPIPAEGQVGGFKFKTAEDNNGGTV